MAVGAAHAGGDADALHRLQARRRVRAGKRDFEDLAILDGRNVLLPRFDVHQIDAARGRRRNRLDLEKVALAEIRRGVVEIQAQAADVQRACVDGEVRSGRTGRDVGEGEPVVGRSRRTDDVDACAPPVFELEPCRLVDVVVGDDAPLLEPHAVVSLPEVRGPP